MDWRTHFFELADHVAASTHDGEGFTLSLEAESSDFVRFNRGRVRQPGTVQQAEVALRWIDAGRHARVDTTLTGSGAEDRVRLDEAIVSLRALVPLLPEDPHLLLAEEVNSTEHVGEAGTPEPGEVVDAVVDAAGDDDLVGIYAGGGSWRGFANHHGQRNWHAAHSFVLDWCLVHDGDKAVKRTWAGRAWDQAAFSAEMAEAREQLRALRSPPRKIEPGAYRVFLTPAAVGEILGLLAWGAFSAQGQHKRTSTLLKLMDGEVALDPRINIAEDTLQGIAPGFQNEGFVKPGRVALVEEGRFAGPLVSPRSAREFGLAPNASSNEQPASIDMAGGALAQADALAALGTGVYVGNLWYLNWSDRVSARATGMTRFATFWVEDGRIVAPIDVMRFDESIYRILGDHLEALTTERSFLPSTSTYGGRSSDSMRLPGVLVRDFALTL